jgi:hypothetical protein
MLDMWWFDQAKDAEADSETEDDDDEVTWKFGPPACIPGSIPL